MSRRALRDLNHDQVQTAGLSSKDDEIVKSLEKAEDPKMYPLRSTRSQTRAKRQTEESEEYPVKRLKSEAPDEVKQEELDNVDADFIKYMTQILGKHYFDVGDRLKLDVVPTCVINVNKCAKDHIFNELDEFWEKEVSGFVNDGKIEYFLRQMTLIAMKGEFPGENLLQLLLEAMLSSNENNVDEILETGETIFIQVLQRNPPCCAQARTKYMYLLTQKLQMDNFHTKTSKRKKSSEKDEGLFNLLISLLDFNLRNDEDVTHTRRDLHNDTTELAFHKWEERVEQTYDFNKNSREDRIHRIFRVLNLLTRILEHDLAIWMLKNPRNAKTGFSKPDKKPLVAALFWKTRDCELNFAVKRLMNIFIECVLLNYPMQDLEVLSRLLNLIGTCINLAETHTIKEKKNFVQFPCVNRDSELFAHEFKRIIDDSPHFSLLLYVNVLKHLRTPYVKHILARLILARITGGQNKLKPGQDTSIHTVLTSLNKKEWLTMGVKVPKEVSTDVKEQLYPVMPQKSTRKTKFEVFQDDFLFFIFTELKSHMEVYRTHDLYNALLLPLEPENELDHQPSFTTFNVKLLQDLSKRIPNTPIFCETLPRNDPRKFTFKSIIIDKDTIMNYREQIKLCYHLQCFLNKIVVKYPEVKEIQTYINEMLNEK